MHTVALYSRGLLRWVIVGIVILAMAAPVPAAVTFYGTFKREFFTQTSNAQPVAPTGLDFIAQVLTNNSGDATMVTATPPAGAVISLSLQPGGLNHVFGSPQFPNRAALNAAYPNGSYVFNISGGGLGAQTGSALGPTDSYPSNVPFLTGNTFTELQSANPSQPLMLTFNGFAPGAQSTSGRLFIGIYDASNGNFVFDSGVLTPSTTTLTLPAATLLPNKDYTLDLLYSSERLDGNAGFGAATAFSAFEGRTAVSIHTVPEPGTLVLCAVGVVCLAARRWRPMRRNAQ